MNRKNCNLIKDLLPVYADGICSEESRKIVAEHIASCDECRRELEMMQTEINIKEQIDTDIKAIKKIKKKIRTGKILTALVSLVTAFLIFTGLYVGLLEVTSEMKPMNYQRNHLAENIFAEEDDKGNVWIVRKGYANDGIIDFGIRVHGSGTRTSGALTNSSGAFGKSADMNTTPIENGVKDAEKTDLVITLAERKIEHILNNTDISGSDERGLLFSRMNLENNLYQNRSLAVDKSNPNNKIAAIYYYDPDTNSEYLLWEEK